eukprot:6730430-Pyramimonas_sp.AAC.1
MSPRGLCNMVVPSWHYSFTCPGHPRGYLTWLPRARTTCFHMSRSLRDVSNMVAPSWHQVLLRVQATQGDIKHGCSEQGPRVFTCP